MVLEGGDYLRDIFAIFSVESIRYSRVACVRDEGVSEKKSHDLAPANLLSRIDQYSPNQFSCLISKGDWLDTFCESLETEIPATISDGYVPWLLSIRWADARVHEVFDVDCDEVFCYTDVRLDLWGDHYPRDWDRYFELLGRNRVFTKLKEDLGRLTGDCWIWRPYISS